MSATPHRIVSFLPSATEMAFALGLGDQLKGVTHECDYPPEATTKPVVIRAALPPGLTQREIDAMVSERLRDGLSLYEPDEDCLRSIAPDLILTQELCAVCAPSTNEIARIFRILPQKPGILWLTPKTLDGIFENVRELGNATQRAAEAEALIAKSRRRLAAISVAVEGCTPARVFCMEWLDPIYCCGHWVPEMVRIAGGFDSLGRDGTDSIRIPWADVQRAQPEIVVVMPCGLSLEQAMSLGEQYLPRLTGWDDLPAARSGRIYAVDANAYFARPGPRVVDGVALLAHLFHPDRVPWNGPAAFRKVACA